MRFAHVAPCVLLAWVGCHTSPGSSDARADAAREPPVRHEAGTTEASRDWARYRPTLLRAGIEGPFAPALEIELAGARGVRVAVVHMERTDPVVSLWDLVPTGDKGVLEPAGEPRLLARPLEAPTPAMGREAIALGRQSEAPGNRVRWPKSPVSAPEELLPALARAARIVSDREAPAPARVEALAEVLAGIDRDLFIRVARWPALLAALARVQGAPEIQGSGRRRQARAGATEWTLLGGARGWKIAGLEGEASGGGAAPVSSSPTGGDGL